MKPRTIILGSVILCGFLALSGMVQGRLSNRWGFSDELGELGKQLESLPETDLGDWQFVSPIDLQDDVRDVLQCRGYFVRSYRQPSTGQYVTVSVIVGPQGPTSVHTPDVCYTGRDYEETGVPRNRETLRGDEFWRLRLKSRSADGQQLQVYYAWNAGNGWQAPKDARFAFLFKPYLFKIQCAAPIALGSEATADPCREFLQVFVPALRKHLEGE